MAKVAAFLSKLEVDRSVNLSKLTDRAPEFIE